MQRIRFRASAPQLDHGVMVVRRETSLEDGSTPETIQAPPDRPLRRRGKAGSHARCHGPGTFYRRHRKAELAMRLRSRGRRRADLAGEIVPPSAKAAPHILRM